jgi:hypothetical protein
MRQRCQRVERERDVDLKTISHSQRIGGPHPRVCVATLAHPD